LKAHTVEEKVREYVKRDDIHKDGGKIGERFTPHCCRHWFTTHLQRLGMPREYVKFLRGDSLNETMNIYNHIDSEELKDRYKRHVP